MELLLTLLMLFSGGNYAVTTDYEVIQYQPAPAIEVYEEIDEEPVYDVIVDDTTVYDSTFDLTQVVNTLAAPELRGRLVGTVENEQAVEYTSAIFESLGLTYFGTNGFLHAYEQEVFNPDYSNAQVTVTLADGTTRELQLGSEFLFRTCTVPADVIFTLDSDGRWINNIPESGWQLRASANRMVVPGRSGLVEDGEVIANPITGAWPAATHVSLYQGLYDELSEIGIEEIHFRADDTRRIETVHNVVGIIEGRDSSRAVVLTAHIDGPGFMGDIQSDGANDNVSGVATIIYAAYILAQHQDELEIDVVFAALNGEETGLIGAFALATYLIERYTELYNLNFDGIGSTGLDAYFIFGEEDHDSYLLSAFMELMTEHGLAYQDLIINLAMGGIADHAVFIYHDIPAISMLQTYLIHTPYDTIDKLDIDEIKLVGRLIAEFILRSGSEMYLRNAS